MCEKNSSFIFQKIVISYTSNSWALQFLANVTQTAVDTDALLGTNFSGGSFFAVVIFFITAGVLLCDLIKVNHSAHVDCNEGTCQSVQPCLFVYFLIVRENNGALQRG